MVYCTHPLTGVRTQPRPPIWHCYTIIIYILYRSVSSQLSTMGYDALGVFIDMFSNTPGVSSFSLTFLSAIQPFVLSSFTSHESAEELKPCIDSLGFGKYLWFVLILTFIYCVVFFSLDMFSFFNLLEWGACILASTLLTIVLILVIENVRRR